MNSAIDEIDKALQELRLSSLDPSKGHLQQPICAVFNPGSKSAQGHRMGTKASLVVLCYCLGFDMDVVGKFARHKITGDILFELDLAHLKELEIDSFGTPF